MNETMQRQGTLRRPWSIRLPGGVGHGLLAALAPRLLPLWLKASFTAFTAAFLSVYWMQPTTGAFVWFLDAALILMVVALWLEARLLASMAALALLVPELLWTLGLLNRLFAGADHFGLARYMFESDTTWVFRLLSAIHAIVPVLLLRMLYRLRYDPRALPLLTLLAWSTLLVSFVIAPVLGADARSLFGVGANLSGAWLPAWLWLLIVLAAFPVLIYLPTHWLLRALFPPMRR